MSGASGAAPSGGAPDDAPPLTADALEERLSRPTPAVLDALARCPGDVVVLGAGGKMGPSLARMARRALDALGAAHAGRRVTAVSRYEGAGGAARRAQLAAWGVETAAADLLDRAEVAALPDAPLVVYMAGLKFGTAAAPARMWATNTVAPALVAERYAGARVVAFSTGNVYPPSPAPGPGLAEDAALTPAGEYANACVARERVLEWVCARHASPLALVRLSYAVDLRYGVLVDVAERVRAEAPVDVSTGWVNVIWQGDASAQALACFAHAGDPALAVNVTGPEPLAVADVARRFGAAFGREVALAGAPAPDALLTSTARAQRLFGPPSVPTERLIDWVAAWLRAGGATLGRPTKFEVRDGRY